MEDQLWNWPRVQVVWNPAKESLNIFFSGLPDDNQMKPCSTTLAWNPRITEKSENMFGKVYCDSFIIPSWKLHLKIRIIEFWESKQEPKDKGLKREWTQIYWFQGRVFFFRFCHILRAPQPSYEDQNQTKGNTCIFASLHFQEGFCFCLQPMHCTRPGDDDGSDWIVSFYSLSKCCCWLKIQRILDLVF